VNSQGFVVRSRKWHRCLERAEDDRNAQTHSGIHPGEADADCRSEVRQTECRRDEDQGEYRANLSDTTRHGAPVSRRQHTCSIGDGQRGRGCVGNLVDRAGTREDDGWTTPDREVSRMRTSNSLQKGSSGD
jgi:hypothetical protein